MKIEWANAAVEDLQHIRDYIARDSAHYAARVVARIIADVGMIADFPKAGRAVPESDDPAVREILSLSYRVIYRLERSRAFVLAVVHGSRDLYALRPWRPAAEENNPDGR